MHESKRKTVLTIAMLIVCACALAAYWLWYPSDLALYVIVSAAVALAVLMKQAAKWNLFQEASSFPIPIPMVKAQWDGRAILVGLLCLPLGAVGGVYAVRLAVVLHLVSSVPMGLLAFLPFLVLMVFGLICIFRGIFGRST